MILVQKTSSLKLWSMVWSMLCHNSIIPLLHSSFSRYSKSNKYWNKDSINLNNVFTLRTLVSPIESSIYWWNYLRWKRFLKTCTNHTLMKSIRELLSFTKQSQVLADKRKYNLLYKCRCFWVSNQSTVKMAWVIWASLSSSFSSSFKSSLKLLVVV